MEVKQVRSDDTGEVVHVFPFEGNRTYITVYSQKGMWPSTNWEKAQINWPSIGAVSASLHLMFSLAMIKANEIAMAMDLRHGLGTCNCKVCGETVRENNIVEMKLSLDVYCSQVCKNS